MKKIAFGILGLFMSPIVMAHSGIIEHRETPGFSPGVIASCWEEKGPTKTPETMAGLFSGFIPNHTQVRFRSTKGTTPVSRRPFRYKLDVGQEHNQNIVKPVLSGPTRTFSVTAMVTRKVTETRSIPLPQHSPQPQPEFENTTVEVEKVVLGTTELSAPSELETEHNKNPTQRNQADMEGQSAEPEKILVKLHDGAPVIGLFQRSQAELSYGDMTQLEFHKPMADLTVKCQVSYGPLN